ncbi:MAG: hypothetical protein AAF927_26855 [Bacteroidota bacterium]
MRKTIMIILMLQLAYSCSPQGKSQESADNFEKELSNHTSDTLAFEITSGNNILFKAILDKTDTLDLYFDTGGTELVLKHSAIKDKTSLLDGKNENYQEENYVPLEGLYSLALNKLIWEDLTIYPSAVGPQEADGHFGWNLFKDKIVELDYDKQIMIVHTTFSDALESYAKMKIEYINTLFCIRGSIKIGGVEYANRYLFDSGFQRAVILDKDLRQKSNFPDTLPVIKESRLRNAAGTEFVNRVVEIDKLCFENHCLTQVPVQLLSTPNPARFETHILGNELLKRFNTVLDFQNGYVYLKPNSLMNLAYKDAS